MRADDLHQTPVARAARAEIARRAESFPAMPPPAAPRLNVRAPDEVAIERLVFSLCHWLLAPLRELSGVVSRSRRRSGDVPNAVDALPPGSASARAHNRRMPTLPPISPAHPPESTPRRKASAWCLTLIRSFESFSAFAYLCPRGRRTIGYGHVLRPGETLREPVTELVAEDLLREDLAPVEIYLSAVLPDLRQNEFDAMASFCFNVGLGAFERSALFSCLRAGDKAGAATQFRLWAYAKGRELPGMVLRRERERALFLGETTP